MECEECCKSESPSYDIGEPEYVYDKWMNELLESENWKEAIVDGESLHFCSKKCLTKYMEGKNGKGTNHGDT